MAGFTRSSASSIFLVLLFLSLSEARDHLVGGKTNAWKIPSSESDSLNHWAEKSRFLIGDSLVWKYDATKDSVLQVTKKDYVTCNTSSPIASYNNGETIAKLENSGPHYFISGAQGHCEKGQKLIVVVMSEKHRRFFVSVSPAPSPVEFQSPAIAPTSSGVSLKGGLGLGFGLFVGFLLM